MWSRRAFVELLAAGALVPAAPVLGLAAGATANPLSRRDEVEAFHAFAVATHPRGPVAAADPDWQKQWNTLGLDADRLSDGAYFHRLRRALGWFRDGHTTVLPFEFVGGVPPQLAGGAFRYSLPLRLRVFHDGAWIVATTAEASPLLGSRLQAIGRLSVPELIRSLADGWPGNDGWAQNWSAGTLVSPAFLQALGATDSPDQPVTCAALGSDGASLRVSLRPRDGEPPTLTPIERVLTPQETWAKAAGRGNYLRPLDGGVCYLSLDDMADVEGQTFESLTRDVFAMLQRKDVNRMVIDLRRNGGGNNYFGEALRKGVARSHLNRPGGLYVLIGPQTFSAAQNLANRLERETFAIFVGEPTGGAPNHYGDAKFMAGEVTGLTTMVSTLPWFDSYPQDPRPWILPDLPVPETGADWLAGRDPTLATAIGHRTNAEPDEWSRDRVFYFRRASQQRNWDPFWRVL